MEEKDDRSVVAPDCVSKDDSLAATGQHWVPKVAPRTRTAIGVTRQQTAAVLVAVAPAVYPEITPLSP